MCDRLGIECFRRIVPRRIYTAAIMKIFPRADKMTVNGHKPNGPGGIPSRPAFRFGGDGSGIIVGDAWHSRQLFPDRTFRCCITSPPYWGLRDYGIPNQIGAEKTLNEYIANLTEIFQQVKRVLRDDAIPLVDMGFLDAVKETFSVYGGASSFLLGLMTICFVGTLLTSGAVWMIGSDRILAVAAYDGAFRAAMASFQTLTDPAALSVLPARVDVVTVPSDMSVDQFQAHFPSTIPVDQVAVINGLERGGSFKAGQKAKRVVGGSPQLAGR